MRTDGPVVDVVIPVRDGERTVVRAIESVLRQTCEDLRLYVVDDGSTDRTRATIEASVDDARVTVTTVPPGGVCTARNAGAALGDAPYIAFLDADDEALPTWLAELTDHPDAEVVRCASYRCVDGTSRQVVEVDGSPLLAGTFVVARPLFQRLGGYDEQLAYSENTDLDIRLHAALDGGRGRIALVPTPLIVRHMDGTRRSDKYGNAALRDAAERLLDKHRARLSDEATASFSAVAGVNSLRLGEPKRARPYLATAVRLAPTRWRYGVRYLQTFLPRPRRRPGERPG